MASDVVQTQRQVKILKCLNEMQFIQTVSRCVHSIQYN